MNVKQSNSSQSNNSDKAERKETKDREDRESRGRDRDRGERESIEKIVTIREKSSTKDSKRDKEENDSRKRDRSEKVRDRERKYYSPISPPTYHNDRSVDGTTSPVYPSSPPKFYAVDGYDDRDRDLSSISNSSKGSNNHRHSQDSPDERDIKRRRIESSKVKIDVAVKFGFIFTIIYRIVHFPFRNQTMM